MKSIKDVCLGTIEFADFGSKLIFDIWNTYDGNSICKICCSGIRAFELKSTLDDEELFGTYIALIEINNMIKDKVVTFESGEVSISVTCSDAIYYKSF